MASACCELRANNPSYGPRRGNNDLEAGTHVARQDPASARRARSRRTSNAFCGALFECTRLHGIALESGPSRADRFAEPVTSSDRDHGDGHSAKNSGATAVPRPSETPILAEATRRLGGLIARHSGSRIAEAREQRISRNTKS
jgi:hypothetical protein